MNAVVVDASAAASDAVAPAIRWAVLRDVRLALRSRAELGVQLLFYVIVVSLFPLATTPERTLLATMGPGVRLTSVSSAGIPGSETVGCSKLAVPSARAMSAG